MPKLARLPRPLLELIGEKDDRMRPCEKYLPRHPSVGPRILPGAYHAFDIAGFVTMRHGHRGAKMLYSETATKTARALIRDLLARRRRNVR